MQGEAHNNNSKEKTKPLRILCFHGWGTNKAIMKMQCAPLLKELKYVDFVFLDAPFPAAKLLLEPELQEYLKGQQVFQWSSKTHSDFDESIDLVVDYMNKNGPFDGLLGFSNGGIFLTKFIEKLDKLSLKFLPSFAILAGTPLLRDVPNLINFPTLHLIGKEDFLYYESWMTATKFINANVIEHSEGHKIPRLDSLEAKTFHNFLKPFLIQKEEFFKVPEKPRL